MEVHRGLQRKKGESEGEKTEQERRAGSSERQGGLGLNRGWMDGRVGSRWMEEWIAKEARKEG